MKENFYNKSYEEVQYSLLNIGFKPINADFLFDKFYKLKNLKHEQLPPFFFEKIEEHFDFNLPQIDLIQTSEDGTIKFLVKLFDGLKVETVLIPFHKKYSICLSTQVGCAMNCSFCFTGTQGLKRNLLAHEIISQYLLAYQYAMKVNLKKLPTPNIVFMGQGEPLHNFEEVKKAIMLFQEVKGLHLGPRQMTISSAGFVPGIKRINELGNINIAISFHSPDNQTRDLLIPINKKYPIEELIENLKNIKLLKRQFITFEYLLIAGLNDSENDASNLANRLKDLKAIVNIIPFNPFPGSKYQRPSLEKVDQFKNYLVALNIRTMVRTTKGDEILAACGQLNTK